MHLKSLAAASAALTLFSGVNAGISVKRTGGPALPSCTDFTPFVYAGCFTDPSTPRALLYSSNLDTQTMTVEKCVAFCKGNAYEYAGMEYYGECFCGASVGGPQIDELNCNYPCTGNKSEACGGNDIISVYQDPTFPVVDDTTIQDYKPMGCYSEGTTGRSLVWRQDQIPAASVTVENCLFACKVGGYAFAGVEYGQECYCGVVLGNGTVPIDSSTCNIPCTGNTAETCGGPSALNLYVAADLESSQPCNGGGPPSSSSVPPSTSTTSTSSSSTSTSTTTTTTRSSSTSITSTSSSTTSTATSTTSSTSSTSSTTSSSKPSTTCTTTTKTTASLCTSTVTVSPTPTCEYQCGKWCSNPLPTWTDQGSCFKAVSACSVQLASCFLHAGFPESLNCGEYASWCTKISSYCSGFCPGNKCSKDGCKSKYPPSRPSVPAPSLSTTVYTCPASTTTPPSKPTTTVQPTTTSCTSVPVPTNTNICVQPHSPSKGYSSSSPVGNIPLPCLTCNNLYNDFKSGFPFKLYTSSDSSRCPSYGRGGNNGPAKACQDACDSQYSSCMNTYAQGCKSKKHRRTTGDDYDGATRKCYSQKQDCYNQNQNVNTGNRCNSWNSGWSR